ncbi:MAG: hypothetical protein RLZZ266_773 [Bacteroidota bacterium]
MGKKILFLLLVFISQNAFTQNNDKEAILKLLAAQVEFWNKGDVNKVMLTNSCMAIGRTIV